MTMSKPKTYSKAELRKLAERLEQSVDYVEPTTPTIEHQYNNKEWITLADISVIANIKYCSVRKMFNDGKFKGVRVLDLGPRLRRFNKQDIFNF